MLQSVRVDLSTASGVDDYNSLKRLRYAVARRAKPGATRLTPLPMHFPRFAIRLSNEAINTSLASSTADRGLVLKLPRVSTNGDGTSRWLFR